MNRRLFIAGLGAAAASRAAGSTEVDIRINPARIKATIPSDFMGLGYEISSVAGKGLLAPENHAYVQLVRTLSSAGVIRIGGNTSDFWRQAPDGPAISALGGFLRATGWKLIWGLNLGTGTAKSAADQAAVVASAAGDRLLCFEIGNEPDLFGSAGHRAPGYGYLEYLQDFRRFAAILRQRLPNVPLAGPDVAISPDWVTSFARDEGRNIQLLTEHYYRGGASNPAATIGSLLNTDPRFPAMTDRLRKDSQSSGLPYRLCELNSFSGGGKPGVSDTFASALWGLDLMFTLAAAGGAGINWETGLNQLGFVSSYSPIFEDERGEFSARPLYYALLAFSKAGRGRLVDLQSDAAGVNLKPYATLDDSGKLWVTLINKDSATNAHARLSFPDHFSLGEVFPLTAPTVDSKTGVRFGGSEVSSGGTWRPVRRPGFRVAAGSVVLEVLAGSASVIRFS